MSKFAIDLNHKGSKGTLLRSASYEGQACSIQSAPRPSLSSVASAKEDGSWSLITFRRAFHWLLPTALFAFMPKCLLCVLAYAGLGALLGFGGPEICGAPAGSPASWASSLAWLGIAGGLGTFGFLASCRRGRFAPAERTKSSDPKETSPENGFIVEARKS